MNKRLLSILLTIAIITYGSAAALGESVSQNGIYDDASDTLQEEQEAQEEVSDPGESSDTEAGSDDVMPADDGAPVSEDTIVSENDDTEYPDEKPGPDDTDTDTDSDGSGKDTDINEDPDGSDSDETETVIDEPDISEDTEDDATENEDTEDAVSSYDEEETYTDEGTEEVEEPAAVEEEISEEQWFEENDIVEKEDGTLEYTDEDGKRWEFAPEDPEVFRRVTDSQTIGSGIEIPLKPDPKKSWLISGTARNPYTLILNTDFKYRYPSYIKSVNDGQLPDVRCGMDISRYQGVISVKNWKTLKEEYGIEFAFIRAGYRGYGAGGSLNEDTCCVRNIRNASRAGVAVGIYYFSQAISEDEAVEEAEHCLQVIEDQKDRITLPVVIDYEYSGAAGRLRTAKLSADEHTAIVNAFCERVKSEGYVSGIYANKSMFKKDMKLDDIPEDNLIWMANFVSNGKNGVYSTTYDGALSAWQFTSRFTGFGEGKKGLGLMKSVNLDLDLWYGDFPGEDRSIEAEADESDESDPDPVSVNSVEFSEEDVEDDVKKKEGRTEIKAVRTYDKENEDEGSDTESIRSISRAYMTAEDVEYSERPRAGRSQVRIYDSDGSRLAAGFDYSRSLKYTYEEETTIKRRTDLWGRRFEEITVAVGDPVEMTKDIIPEGAVIRVTAEGKGRYKDPDEDNNTVSAVYSIVSGEQKESEDRARRSPAKGGNGIYRKLLVIFGLER